MSKSLSPSKPITEGQIGKVQELLGALLRKHREEFSSDVVQSVLMHRGATLQREFLSIFSKNIEYFSDMVVRNVLVKGGRTPQEAINATVFDQDVDNTVMVDLLNNVGKNRKVTVSFFKLGRVPSDEELEREYLARGLMPADFYTLAAVNEVDRDFSNQYPNATHWKDNSGDWCFVFFHYSCRYSCHHVLIKRRRSLFGDWWFAGVPRKTAKHIIDCDADPFVPEGWTVMEHIKGGQLEFDPSKIEVYLDQPQKIVNKKLRWLLVGKPVLNANVLDYLLAHPELIPDKWKDKTIFFWGTIYRNSNGYLCVRCLRWYGDKIDQCHSCLTGDFFDDYPAVAYKQDCNV